MNLESPATLANRNVLVTGIVDRQSLALPLARELMRQGATPVCTGLGPSQGQSDLSERARDHLQHTFESFRETVAAELGPEVPTYACDLSNDQSIAGLVEELAKAAISIDGVVHAVAFDRTLRAGQSVPLLETSREDFLECMNISAYSLIALLRGLVQADRLARDASVVALSYIGAERVVSHPYRNVGVAKAALERIVVELAAELGASHGARVNTVRFSPWTASRAGGAIPSLEEAERDAARRAPLGNATPSALAYEVAHLLRPGVAITGECRAVDGGFHRIA